MHATNNRAAKHVKLKPIELKVETDKSKIIIEDFIISLSTNDKKTRQEISEDKDKLSKSRTSGIYLTFTEHSL